MTADGSIRVTGWAADQEGCGYYRLGLPLYVLNQQDGWECDVNTFLRPRWYEGEDQDVDGILDATDVLFGQRLWLEPASVTWLKACARPDVTTIFEIDDDLFNVHRTNPGAWETYSRDDVQARLKENIAAADAVTCTNSYLAEVVGQWNPRVYVIPNYIHEGMLGLPDRSDGEFSVGWGGGFSHRMDFAAHGSAIAGFFDANPKYEFTSVGYDLIGEYLKRPEQVQWRKGVSDVHRYYEMLDFSVGLAPLARDVFNDSKSSIKCLEYQALGIVPIASEEAPYRDFITHGVDGFLARRRHPEDWERWLRRLAGNPKLRRKMAAAGRAHAAENTIQRNVGAWADTIRSAMAGAGSRAWAEVELCGV